MQVESESVASSGRRSSKRLAESVAAAERLLPAQTPAKLPKRQLGSEPTMQQKQPQQAPPPLPVAAGPKPATSAAARRSRLGVSLLQKKPFAVARRHAMPGPGPFPVPPAAALEPDRPPPPLGPERSLSHTSAAFPTSTSAAPASSGLSSTLASSFHEFRQEQHQNPAGALASREQNASRPGEHHCGNQMDLIKSASRLHSWHWDDTNKSHECIVSNDKLEVCFHPQCSESAAAIIGSQPLKRNGNYYYWEVTVFDKTYGTSVMFGLCTKQQQLHANDYCNLVGLDKNGWSLSHKGLIWHNGMHSDYTGLFPPNQTITLGLLFNTMRGELSYFMNGVNMGVAFYGLNNINEDLYPVVGSTAKCTRMKLLGSYCGYESLLERSCFTLLKKSSDKFKFIQYLKEQRVPKNLVLQLAEIADAVCGSQTKNKTDQNDQYSLNNNNNQQLIKD